MRWRRVSWRAAVPIGSTCDGARVGQSNAVIADLEIHVSRPGFRPRGGAVDYSAQQSWRPAGCWHAAALHDALVTRTGPSPQPTPRSG